MKPLKLIFFLCILQGFTVVGQNILNLNDCYKLLSENYPIATQNSLLNKQNKLDINAINKERLPHLGFSAKAMYQSDVTSVPVSIPGINIQSPNQDQYRATLTANQLIYNAGLISKQIQEKNINYKIKHTVVDVSIYQLKFQVNTLYYSILLAEQKTNLLKDKIEQLNLQKNELTNKVKLGNALPSSKALLKAETLKINQQIYETKNSLNGFIKSLSLLIGKQLSNNIELQIPEFTFKPHVVIKRPELAFYDLRKQQTNRQISLLNIENKPKLSAFIQGGYGNPGLNLFDHHFDAFYIIGMQLNWNIFDWNIIKKKRQSISINQQIIDTQKKEFTLKTKLATTDQETKIKSLIGLIKTDKQIIPLRKQVLQTANHQLQNGIITPSQYIIELTNFYESKINLKTHLIELAWAKTNYLTITGNYENKN